QRGIVLQRREYAESIQLGHLDIEDHQVVLALANRRQRRLAIADIPDVAVAEKLELEHDRLAQLLVVVDDEDVGVLALRVGGGELEWGGLPRREPAIRRGFQQFDGLLLAVAGGSHTGVLPYFRREQRSLFRGEH